MRTTPATWLPPALIAVACLLDLARPGPQREHHSPPAHNEPSVADEPVESPPRPLTDGEEAVLRPIRENLRPGRGVGEGMITKVLDDRPAHPLIIAVRRGRETFRITVAPLGLFAEEPRAKTARHAIYVRSTPPNAEPAAMLAAVAAVVRERE